MAIAQGVLNIGNVDPTNTCVRNKLPRKKLARAWRASPVDLREVYGTSRHVPDCLLGNFICSVSSYAGETSVRASLRDHHTADGRPKHTTGNHKSLRYVISRAGVSATNVIVGLTRLRHVNISLESTQARHGPG